MFSSAATSGRTNVGCRVSGGEVFFLRLAREDEQRVDARVRAAGDIRVDAVAHEQCFLRGNARLKHCELRHQRFGLADDDGAAGGRAPEHFAHAPAVGHEAAGRGADPVGIGRKVGDALSEQDAGVLQLLKCQLGVEAHQERVRVLTPFCDGKASRAEL